jgi:hypothetical protein
LNREILIALLGTLLALAIGFAFLQPTSDVNAPSAQSSASSSPSMSGNMSGSIEQPAEAARAQGAGSTGPTAAASSVSPLAKAEAEWRSASALHQAAARALEESEQSLNDVEREIEAVERFVEDLEERGDDPADFAEEGMAKLRPAIERFEARLEIVERNELLEAEAGARLEAAEAELARQQAASR